MAIYSLNLKSIGKTTHAAGTAGAHVLYIGRDGAEPELIAEHMPADPQEARTFLDQAERGDRKNARIIDKIRLALPRELDEEQRAQLVVSFARDLTDNRTPWYAAIHQTGKDAHNPHCHLVIRDRDIETGKRVAKLSDSAKDRAKRGLEGSAADWVRARWEHHANTALEQAGVEARIDRRSLEAQGIDRAPTIHIGPRAAHIDKQVKRPESRRRIDGRGREIDYPLIDAGRTRRERNAEIIDLNLERDARSADFATRERAKFVRAEIQRDRVLESRLIEEARRRTEKERRALAGHRAEIDAARKEWREEQSFTRARLASEARKAREAMRLRQDAATASVKEKQSKLISRMLRMLDITGGTRRKHAAEKEALRRRQLEERHALRIELKETRQKQIEAIDARRKAVVDELKRDASRTRTEHQAMRREAEHKADAERQVRAAERSRSEATFEKALKAAEQRRKSMGRDNGFEMGG